MDYEQVLPYIPNLRRYARALVGDRDSADDLGRTIRERRIRSKLRDLSSADLTL